MENNDYQINKLQRHIDKYGAEGLLPQNLPDELLQKMIHENDMYISSMTDSPPSHLVVSAVVLLMNKTVDPNELSKENIDLSSIGDGYAAYMKAVYAEEGDRLNLAFLTEESVPTLQNILDHDRIISVIVPESRGIREP